MCIINRIRSLWPRGCEFSVALRPLRTMFKDYYGQGAQNVRLDFYTAPELWCRARPVLPRLVQFSPTPCSFSRGVRTCTRTTGGSLPDYLPCCCVSSSRGVQTLRFLFVLFMFLFVFPSSLAPVVAWQRCSGAPRTQK